MTLEYVGDETISRDGLRRRAGVPVRFIYERFEPTMSWQLRAFAWTDSTDPRTKPEAFASLLRSTPLITRIESRLDYFWYRPTIASMPQSRMALDATTSLTLPPGDYTLRALSDDAVRVWVDNVLVIEDWTPHETRPSYATIGGGAHNIRVQYVQVDEWTELRFDIMRGVHPSAAGSPGPH